MDHIKFSVRKLMWIILILCDSFDVQKIYFILCKVLVKHNIILLTDMLGGSKNILCKTLELYLTVDSV